MNDMKRNAYDVIACLIENMHEGFHGTSYEMFESLRACDAITFDMHCEYAMSHAHVVRDARAFATCDNEFIDDDFNTYINEYVMSRMYRDVVAQMINVIVDHTSRIVDNSTQSLHIRINDMSRDIVEYIVRDLSLCVETCDVDQSTFDETFFITRIID